MNHFDYVANEWDSPEKVKLMNTLAKKSLSKLNLNQEIDILDFGCGTGLFGLEFLSNAKSLTGIDLSKGMLEVFDQKTKNLKNVSSIYCDLVDNNIDMKFDLIVSSMAFHHLKDPTIVLSKMKNMLNPNGQIMIVDLDQEDGTFHPNNKEMGVFHLGFNHSVINTWANNLSMELDYSIINSLEKNNNFYNQFLALFSI